jgi:histidinol-phosphatase (PHP family)
MAAESKLFEIIGHADLPKKFCYYPQRDCTPLFERFLAAVKKADVAIELNTAGWRKECKEIYPAPAMLRLAHSKGVPITFGSDAHAPNEVGMDLPRALELARSIGYSQRCRFVQRRRDFVAI